MHWVCCEGGWRGEEACTGWAVKVERRGEEVCTGWAVRVERRGKEVCTGWAVRVGGEERRKP
jgi:hypothetical protein